jgi:radical SAM superfamily enzyme YgiQ (UPF0313 family)
MRKESVTYMKILLINPPIPRAIRMLDFADEQARKSFGRRVMVGPPLALNELAGMTPNEEVIIIDQKTEIDNKPDYNFCEEYLKELELFKPDMVGITCITAQYNSVIKLIDITKKFNSRILTMVGGLHPTLCTNSFLGSNADIISLGIGKYSFRCIVEAFKKDGWQAEFNQIPGLALNKGTKFEYTKSLCNLGFEEVKKNYLFDEVLPDRSLTDKYNYTIKQMDKKIHYISTSQGCTHKCNFCSIWPMTDGRYFHKDVECIIRELKTMDQYPIIRFCDANTFGDINKANTLFTRIIEEGLDKHFYMADVRTDTVIAHPELMELAAKAGLKITICGLEATSNEELQAYNKKNTVENISEALKILNQLGIYVNGNYIVKPDYVEKDFERLAYFVENNPIYNSGFTVLTPFPGTDLWEIMKNDVVNYNYDYYNLTNAVVKTVLPEKEFYGQIAQLYRINKQTAEKYMKVYGKELLTD